MAEPKIYDILAVSAAAAVVVTAVTYAEIVYTYDLTTFIVSVVSPVVVGSFFIALRNRTMLYAY